MWHNPLAARRRRLVIKPEDAADASPDSVIQHLMSASEEAANAPDDPAIRGLASRVLHRRTDQSSTVANHPAAAGPHPEEDIRVGAAGRSMLRRRLFDEAIGSGCAARNNPRRVPKYMYVPLGAFPCTIMFRSVAEASYGIPNSAQKSNPPFPQCPSRFPWATPLLSK